MSERMIGVIVSAIAPGWWIVRDAANRKFRVAGSGSYRRGDQVAVVAGQIVGAAGEQAIKTTYQV